MAEEPEMDWYCGLDSYASLYVDTVTLYYVTGFCMSTSALNAPIATKVVCYCRLLKCLRSLYDKQYGLRSDCSYRSSLFWVHAVFFYTLYVSYVRQLFAADIKQTTFSDAFFLGALRVNMLDCSIVPYM